MSAGASCGASVKQVFNKLVDLIKIAFDAIYKFVANVLVHASVHASALAVAHNHLPSRMRRLRRLKTSMSTLQTSIKDPQLLLTKRLK